MIGRAFSSSARRLLRLIALIPVILRNLDLERKARHLRERLGEDGRKWMGGGGAHRRTSFSPRVLNMRTQIHRLRGPLDTQSLVDSQTRGLAEKTPHDLAKRDRASFGNLPWHLGLA